MTTPPSTELPLDLTDRLRSLEIQETQPKAPPWVELPLDITANILHRLGAIEILESAQKVCTTWRNVCKNPAMWRVIDMESDGGDYNRLVKICRHAVDRSQGQLEEINLDHLFSDDKLFDYITTSCGNLRRLGLFSFLNLANGCLTEAALKRFPKFELLDVHVFQGFHNEAIEMFGRSSPLLTSFAFKKMVFGSGRSSFEFHTEAFGSTCADDDEAFAIARSMPKLRHLKLVKNDLTNIGLRAILDGCPLLESLDLLQCFNLKLKKESALVERLSCLKCSR